MSYPETPVFQAIGFDSISPTLISEAVNGRTQTRQIAGQRWAFSAKYPPMTRADFMPVYAFIMQQRGQKNTFTVTVPIIEDARGTASGTLAVNNGSGYTAGGTVVTVDGITGTIVEGDLVKFANHDKVYMVVAHTETTGNTTSITIEPPLRAALVDNEGITYDDVPVKVRLKNDVQSYDLRVDSLIEYEVDFIEAL